MISNLYRVKFLITVLIILLLNIGCKKFVTIDPPVTSFSEGNVFKTDETAAAVLTGIYSKMSGDDITSGTINSLSVFPSLYVDDLTLMGGVGNQIFTAYYSDALSSSNLGGTDFWLNFYPKIYDANFAISGLEASTSLSSSIKQQLLGEAKFIRAFYYFNLVNLYGDLPVALSVDYKTNSLLHRAEKSKVWQQIISDLLDAHNTLSDSYLSSDIKTAAADRVRPTKWAAAAMLARAYLYLQDWSKAETYATEIIDNKAMFDTVSLSSVFLKGSKEAIWQLQPVLMGQNTQEARLFILPDNGPDFIHPFYLNKNLVNSFENGDKRTNEWIRSIVASPGNDTFYFPFKYRLSTTNDPSPTEYSTVLRLAEQYLIRAEARAQQGKLSESKSDLDVIRARAGLQQTSAPDKTSLLDAIFHERRVELFTEWGQRWFDIKRSTTVDAIMNMIAAQKGFAWSSFKQWFPIPLAEIRANPNLTQNNGY